MIRLKPLLEINQSLLLEADDKKIRRRIKQHIEDGIIPIDADYQKIPLINNPDLKVMGADGKMTFVFNDEYSIKDFMNWYIDNWAPGIDDEDYDMKLAVEMNKPLADDEFNPARTAFFNFYNNPTRRPRITDLTNDKSYYSTFKVKAGIIAPPPPPPGSDPCKDLEGWGYLTCQVANNPAETIGITALLGAFAWYHGAGRLGDKLGKNQKVLPTRRKTVARRAKQLSTQLERNFSANYLQNPGLLKTHYLQTGKLKKIRSIDKFIQDKRNLAQQELETRYLTTMSKSELKAFRKFIGSETMYEALGKHAVHELKLLWNDRKIGTYDIERIFSGGSTYVNKEFLNRELDHMVESDMKTFGGITQIHPSGTKTTLYVRQPIKADGTPLTSGNPYRMPGVTLGEPMQSIGMDVQQAVGGKFSRAISVRPRGGGYKKFTYNLPRNEFDKLIKQNKLFKGKEARIDDIYNSISKNLKDGTSFPETTLKNMPSRADFIATAKETAKRQNRTFDVSKDGDGMYDYYMLVSKIKGY